MGIVKKLIAKIVGKKIDAQLGKWEISKAKVVAIIAALVVAYETAAPGLGLPPIPPYVKELLAAAGLWAMRDAVDEKPKNA